MTKQGGGGVPFRGGHGGVPAWVQRHLLPCLSQQWGEEGQGHHGTPRSVTLGMAPVHVTLKPGSLALPEILGATLSCTMYLYCINQPEFICVAIKNISWISSEARSPRQRVWLQQRPRDVKSTDIF